MLGVVICVAVFSTMTPSVRLATELHEDPETAAEVFSGISLFRYYSSALNSILQKAPQEVEARLLKMPFAHIPPNLEPATANFTLSGINLSYLVVVIGEDLNQLTRLMKQFRLEEAAELGNQIRVRITRAHSELEQIEQATVITGKELKINSAPADSELRRSYEEVLERISKIRQMLAFYEELLESVNETIEKLLTSKDSSGGELLKLTEVTLKIFPAVSYIGDYIYFWGRLTSRGEPMAEREIDILINSLSFITVKTNKSGYFHDKLRIPYWYLNEMDLQALFYPRGEDVGVNLASLSPVTTLKTLFYQADLKIDTEDKAYPGRDSAIRVALDYGRSPLPGARDVEIYFDDVLIAKGIAGEKFTHNISLKPEVNIGEHVITISAAARGKYSPVVASVILDVTRATPILRLTTPAVVMIPGSFELSGEIYSEVEPLRSAPIKLQLGKSQVELVSTRDGTFTTRIKAGMDFGLIGWQDLQIESIPLEPWHTPFSIKERLLVVNFVNCIIFIIILVLLGIFLPSRLKRRLGVYSTEKIQPVISTSIPDTAPTYSQTIAITLPELDNEAGGEPRNRVFYWYRRVVRLLAGMTKVILGPQQTLREFAKENSKILGPAAKYFIELTNIVERSLYSQYKPTEEDTAKSRKLSRSIEEGIKGEGI